MTKPPIFHDRRSDPPESGWRIDPGTVGILVFVAIIVGWIFTMLAFSRTPTHTAADEAAENKCLALVKAETDLRIASECHSETFAACLAHDTIVADWEKRARACQRP